MSRVLNLPLVSLTCLVGYAQPNTNQNTSTVEQSAELTIIIGEVFPTDADLHPLMLGVISGPEPTIHSNKPTLTTEYQDIGVTAIRNNDYHDDRLDIEGILNCGESTYPSWEGCDAHDDRYYDWAKSDAQFQSYLDNNFIPFLRVGGEWQNSLTSHQFKGPQNEAQENNWIIAASKMVDRYKHWPGASQTMTYVDLWTEFPGKQFWDRSDQEFVDFWVKAYKTLKNDHPDLQIGGPGFAPLVGVQVMAGEKNVAVDLLTALYGEKIHLDWLGWHHFGADIERCPQLAQAYQELLAGTGRYADVPWAGTGFFANTEVFVDAYGVNPGAAPDGVSKVSIDSGEGAARLTAAWIAFHYADIQGAFYYRGNDQGDSKNTKNKGQAGAGLGLSGLFYNDGQYKISAQAFKLWSYLSQHYPVLLNTNVPADGSTAAIWVLAAEDSEGNSAVLLANPTAAAVTYDLLFNGQPVSALEKKLVLQLVNDSHAGVELLEPSADELTIPAHSVQLLEIKN